MDAMGLETVERALKAQAGIAYNIMMGNLDDPNEEEEEEGE